jgi:hypothetical protein
LDDDAHPVPNTSAMARMAQRIDEFVGLVVREYMMAPAGLARAIYRRSTRPNYDELLRFF